MGLQLQKETGHCEFFPNPTVGSEYSYKTISTEIPMNRSRVHIFSKQVFANIMSTHL